MVSPLEFIFSINFTEIILAMHRGDLFTLIFPFLIIYVLMFISLQRVKIFHYKKSGKPMKSVIVIIALIVSLTAVFFEIREGKTLGHFISLLFPNISVLTISILCLYILGGMLGKDFFNGLFNPEYSSYLKFLFGGVGLGMVVFYTGIIGGFWNFAPFDQGSMWNMIVALFLLILGITFLFIHLVPLGVIFIIVFGAYVATGGEESILSLFFDPAVFMFIIFTAFFSWTNKTPNTDKFNLARSLREGEDFLKDFEGKNQEHYRDTLYDIIKPNFDKNLAEWKQKYGDDDWHNFYRE